MRTSTPATPGERIEAMIDEYVAWARDIRWHMRHGEQDAYKELPHYQHVLHAQGDEKRGMIVALAGWLSNTQERQQHYWTFYSFFVDMLDTKLPFTHDEVLAMIHAIGSMHRRYPGMPQILKRYLAHNALTPELQEAVAKLVQQMSTESHPDNVRKAAALAKLANLRATKLLIRRGEVWADRAIEDIDAMDADVASAWVQMIDHCMQAKQSKPTKAWTKSALLLLDEIGVDSFKTQVMAWFPLVDQPGTPDVDKPWQHPLLIAPINADILRGLVWLCTHVTDATIPDVLVDLAVSCYRKIPGSGPRCMSVANACIWVLGMREGIESVSHLARLRVKIKQKPAQKSINKALAIAAEREGITREEIEEISVPTFGMQDVGVRREAFGDFTAELRVVGTTTTALTWVKPDGKPQKSVPKAVKEDYNEELKALKKAAQDIKKLLPAHRERIDNLYLQQKQWALPAWKARYLDHPLVGTLTRRLIWMFNTESGTTPGIWHEGQLVDIHGTPLAGLSDTTTVSLWHPLDADTDAIVAWRNWLLQHEIQQPFKQAYREIYLLTDAERTTNVYSNRFAAHIIRQHQFNALCLARGWDNSLRLMVDDEYDPASKKLPLWNLRVEYWVEGVGDEYGTDTNDTGTFFYLATDQVRFYPIDSVPNTAHAMGGGYRLRWGQTEATAPIPLSEIPPLVFSEIMRDVDLFVGVASIGNDPNWIDRGDEVRHNTYWRSYAFGDLSATAQTRKSILAQLLPALTIADRCELEGKFLKVRGDIRSYKIHLGSGNILMDPNNQYLCIVPDQRGRTHSGKVFLPFEGDNILAVVLSKAFMLADDTKITDKTILSQIRG